MKQSSPETPFSVHFVSDRQWTVSLLCCFLAIASLPWLTWFSPLSMGKAAQCRSAGAGSGWSHLDRPPWSYIGRGGGSPLLGPVVVLPPQHWSHPARAALCCPHTSLRGAASPGLGKETVPLPMHSVVFILQMKLVVHVARGRWIIQHLQSKRCNFSCVITWTRAWGNKRTCPKVGDHIPARKYLPLFVFWVLICFTVTDTDLAAMTVTK